MEPRVIKTESDYHAALAAIERLLDLNPEVGTEGADALELLTLLVQEYESKQFPTSLPDPITAVRFRMEQQGLAPRDLVPYLGSRSKVSEVLSGKRPLTLAMIRALHTGLRIPANALLQGRHATLKEEEDEIEWSRFPVHEMIERGWIAAKVSDARERAKELMQSFFSPIGAPNAIAARYLKKDHIRSARTMDRHALAAWSARILICAGKGRSAEFKSETVNLKFMRDLAQLSWSAQGPLLAREFLENHGIALIIEPHLSRTFLDGAAMISASGKPVIGLTVRRDRVDNFWFSLMHELAHIALHLSGDSESFFDDLDTSSHHDSREKEADKLAGEALIPNSVWAKSPAKSLRSPEAAQHLAQELKIHPAIVAGRMRHEAKNYRILNQMIGHGEVRRLFSDIQWN